MTLPLYTGTCFVQAVSVGMILPVTNTKWNMEGLYIAVQLYRKNGTLYYYTSKYGVFARTNSSEMDCFSRGFRCCITQAIGGGRVRCTGQNDAVTCTVCMLLLFGTALNPPFLSALALRSTASVVVATAALPKYCIFLVV